MATYGIVIFYSLVGGVFSLVGGVYMLRSQKSASKLATYATPFAAGALLATVFLDLLKEGINDTSVNVVMSWALVGIVLFFFAERFLHWFHHHHEHKNSTMTDPGVSLIIVGDTIHNALDGVAIAAAFLVSVPVGIVTTFAVAMHEIPQEIGDFGLLLKRGLSRRRVLIVNLISALATTIMAVITFALGSSSQLPIGGLLGLSAGFLLYIAMSDIIPEIHNEASRNKQFFDLQPVLLLLGIIVVGLSITVIERFIG